MSTDKLIKTLVDISILYGEKRYELNNFIGEANEDGSETRESAAKRAELLAEKTKLFNQIEILRGVLSDS